jgi:helix-turn-helix protein
MMLAILATGLLGLTELPPQPPAPGRCRTFLWTRTEAPVRIAMIDESSQTMRLRKGKQMFDIAQFAPNQFGGHGYRVSVQLAFASGGQIQNGQIIESGSIRIEDASGSGEAMVVPVGGMRGCG